MALLELSIKNFAIIEHLDVEFDDGLSVITGETGAGKSIVLDALNLLLGARAENSMIRHGEQQSDLAAQFDLAKLEHVQTWLAERELNNDEPQYCLVRRVVRLNKPTKCYINDHPTTLSTLKELGLMLVDLHGQHEHQSLLRVAEQRKIIDQFAEHQTELGKLKKLAQQVNQLHSTIDNIDHDQTQAGEQIELLTFQLEELAEANIEEGEFESLVNTQSRLSNAKQLTDGLQLADDALFHNEQFNISAELGKTVQSLSQLSNYDTEINATLELLNGALSQIDESQQSLNTCLARVEQDPERLHEIDQRIETLVNLARKHRCQESELLEKQNKLQHDYDRLKKQLVAPDELRKELDALLAQYQTVAQSVSEKRQMVAATLSKSITEKMQVLGMKGGAVKINVQAKTDLQAPVSEYGIDQIEYLVSTNQGVPLKPLQRTASGGELSRISLAIQVITSSKAATPCLIFDEVDVGVGGQIAGILGEQLHQLGSQVQTLCITHLPQVAANGDHHYIVQKQSQNQITHSNLSKLDEQQRVQEIARMLGGKEVTDRTLAHAEEMLNAAKTANN